jgi:dTDP-glucose 4,6-dehydratase
MRIYDGWAVPNFIAQLLQKKDVTVFGNGQQTRSFCYISDLVQGVIRLMQAETNDPVNLGNLAELTIEAIVRKIIKATGSTSRIVYQALPVDDPKVRRPDTSRARALLGWEPTVSLDDGLIPTIAYFRQKLAAQAT